MPLDCIFLTYNCQTWELIESNYIDNKADFNIDVLKKLLIEKFNEIDYDDAKNDIIPFIKDVTSINIWSKEFFISITDNLS